MLKGYYYDFMHKKCKILTEVVNIRLDIHILRIISVIAHVYISVWKSARDSPHL